jgi:hypothetical protein
MVYVRVKRVDPLNLLLSDTEFVQIISDQIVRLYEYMDKRVSFYCSVLVKNTLCYSDELIKITTYYDETVDVLTIESNERCYNNIEIIRYHRSQLTMECYVDDTCKENLIKYLNRELFDKTYPTRTETFCKHLKEKL